MPSNRWTNLLLLVIGAVSLLMADEVSAFQRVPQLSDPIHTRPIHRPEEWSQRGFASQAPFNQSPADYGPAIGMSSRTPSGNPASGDQFPVMQPGSLPGGFAPHGFNSSGMNPPVNQPDRIANNPIFGGPGSNQGDNGVGSNGQMGQQFGPDGQPMNQQRPNGFGSSPQQGQNGYAQNGYAPNAYGPNPNRPTTTRPRMQLAATSAVPSKPTVVGLLGQFARPGSYELGTEPLMLAQLIEQVGGMAKDAAGQLKVIRNGRPGQSLTVAGAEHFELLPGDLVIAESTPGANRSQAGDSNPAGANASAGSNRGPSAVQIGFVNLLDRPVVLKLRSEHASVAAILNIMQQDTSLAGQVQVILPSSHRFSGRVHPNMPLPSESVVMFPPNVVATDRLAGLPAPTKLDAAGNRDSADPAQPGLKLSNPNQNGQSPLGQGAADSEVPAPPTEGSPGSRLRLPNAVGAGHEASEMDDSANVPPVPSLDAGEPTRFNTPGQQRPINAVKSSGKSDLDSLEINDGSEPNPSGWGTVAPIVIIALSLTGLLVLSLWLCRRTVAERQLGTLKLNRRRAPSPVVAAKRQTETESVDEETVEAGRVGNPTYSDAKRELLESLIQNQVPMTEERVAFSSPMHFHGRPNAPKLVRVDAGHDIPKPHVSAVDVTEPQRLVREPITGVAKVQPRIDRSAKVSTPVSSRSAFERALSSVRDREEHS